MDGGAELIGTNHPLWNQYRQRFSLTFLKITEEDAEAPILLNGRRLTEAESEQLWKEMTDALAGLNRDAAAITDPLTPWSTANAVALDRRSLGEWIAEQSVSPLCRIGIDAQMTADNGMTTAWQSYLGNLAMIKGGGVEQYWTETEVYRCAGGTQQLALHLAARSWRSRASPSACHARLPRRSEASPSSPKLARRTRRITWCSRFRHRPGIGLRSRRGCRSPRYRRWDRT